MNTFLVLGKFRFSGSPTRTFWGEGHVDNLRSLSLGAWPVRRRVQLFSY